MSATRYVTIAILVLVGASFAWLTLAHWQTGASTASSAPVCSLIQQKLALARGRDGPAILLAAGSNVHYGLSAEQIEAALGRPTLNLGVHAALPLDLILERVASVARSGDVVVVAPEYAYYARAGTNAVWLDYLFACGTDYLMRRGSAWRVRAALALGPARLLAGSLGRLGMSRAADLFAYMNLPPPAGERYASDVAIGRRGDAIGNRAADITATLRRRVREAEPVTLALDPESPGSKALVRFAAWTRGHGVKLVATWPNIRRFDAYQSPVADRFFSDVRQFYRKLAVPVIGSPHDAMFEADAFYDTIYHLHRSAVERRTTRLLPHLLDQLGSGSGVSGPLSGSVGSAT